MKKGLLLIDIQNDYFDGGKNPVVGSIEACQNAKLVLAAFRNAQLPVYHIQHISARPGASFFLPNTEGAEIHNDVKPLAKEEKFVKNFPNSFRDTKLLEVLKRDQITEVVICGMMTHMCVDATTRAAKDFGFNCTLIADACATKNLEFQGSLIKAEDVHKSFLAALAYFYASIVNTNDFLKNFGN